LAALAARLYGVWHTAFLHNRTDRRAGLGFHLFSDRWRATWGEHGGRAPAATRHSPSNRDPFTTSLGAPIRVSWCARQSSTRRAICPRRKCCAQRSCSGARRRSCGAAFTRYACVLYATGPHHAVDPLLRRAEVGAGLARAARRPVPLRPGHGDGPTGGRLRRWHRMRS